MENDSNLSGGSAWAVGRVKESQLRGAAVFSEGDWSWLALRLGLSVRELQIAKAVFDDQIESAIAEDLGVSVHTVHTHMQRLHKKLQVSNRVQLILRLVEEFRAMTGH